MDKYTKEIMTLIKENFKDVIGDKIFQNTSDARSFYLVDLVDNICEPMGDNALIAYGQGSGNEIASGKMNALRSSSALTYNLFGNKPAYIRNNSGDLRIGNGVYSVEFEKQYHTLKPTVPGNPANLDAFLYCEESEEAIACEMKMMEWIFNKPSNLRYKYMCPENYIDKKCAEIFIPIAKELILYNDYDDPDDVKEEYPCRMTRYDAFQMFKHTVACYSACAGEESRSIKKLTLINCVWTLPVPDRLSPNAYARYIREENCEHTEFNEFMNVMQPVKTLFSDLNVDFDIKFYTFNDFLSLLKKTDNELNYLKRYTFDK
ncbi:MAG: hypothetical protein IJC89_04645 [Clostridia bacterium]|nr:hypothetical protein [Clostridia bacterium]